MFFQCFNSDAIVEENTLNSVKLRKTGKFFCTFDS